MTRYRAFLVGAFCAMFCAPSFAGIGSVDTRQYADWSSDQFSRYVTIGSAKYWRCTGQYVAPNLVLTAAHCYDGTKSVGRTEWMTSPLVNETITGKVIAIGDYKDLDSTPENDWALILIKDEKYYYPKSNFFKPDDLNTSKEYEPVINAGFGWARIVSDDEIKILRKTFQSVASGSRTVQIQDIKDALNRAMKDNDLQPFAEDHARLKYDNCNVVINTDCTKVCNKNSLDYNQNKCKDICGNRSKLFKNSEWPKVLGTTCDSWGGNSGGAYFSRNTGNLISICSHGHDGFSDDDETDYALSVAVLNKVISDARAKYPVNTSGNTESPVVTNTLDVVAENSQEQSDGGMSATYIEDTIQQTTDNVVAIVNDGNISDTDVLNIIDGLTSIQKLEEEYKKAYENEHSFANRMISGVSMGAMGIGGMKLAEGLSEQSADAAAARDMEAYMATFQCKIGNAGGKTYTGGTKSIELPGANQLTPIYQEYVDLAASVKQRKNDLGMTPGIESQVILDKANMGLYDDEGHGIENGTYASLYRAAMGSEKDNAKLAEQKDSAASKVKGGAIAAGGGALVGVGGNILNNYVDWGGDSSSSSKSSSSNSKSSSGLDLSGIKDSIGDVDISKVGSMVGGFVSGAK